VEIIRKKMAGNNSEAPLGAVGPGDDDVSGVGDGVPVGGMPSSVKKNCEWLVRELRLVKKVDEPEFTRQDIESIFLSNPLVVERVTAKDLCEANLAVVVRPFDKSVPKQPGLYKLLPKAVRSPAEVPDPKASEDFKKAQAEFARSVSGPIVEVQEKPAKDARARIDARLLEIAQQRKDATDMQARFQAGIQQITASMRLLDFEEKILRSI
jgi:hypothetical protein